MPLFSHVATPWKELGAAVQAGNQGQASWLSNSSALSNMMSPRYYDEDECAEVMRAWDGLLDRGWVGPALNILRRVNAQARGYLLTSVLVRRDSPDMKSLLSDVKRECAVPASAQMEEACARGDLGVLDHLLSRSPSKAGLVLGFTLALKKASPHLAQWLWPEVRDRGLVKSEHISAAMSLPSTDWLRRLLPALPSPEASRLWGTALTNLIEGTRTREKKGPVSPVLTGAVYTPDEATHWLVKGMHLLAVPSETGDPGKESRNRLLWLDHLVKQAVTVGSTLLPVLLENLPPDLRFQQAMEAAVSENDEAMIQALLPRTEVEVLHKRWSKRASTQWPLLDRLATWVPLETAQVWVDQHKDRLPQALARVREAAAQGIAPPDRARHRSRVRA